MPTPIRTIQRIAVMRYRFIGDSILTLPFLYRLRIAYPNAEIHLYTSNDSIDLMRVIAPVNKCIEYEPRRLSFLQRIQTLKNQHYDRVYILKRSFSSALYPFLAGIPERIGFATEARQLLLTRAVPYKSKLQHEAQCYLDLLADFAKDIPLELPDLNLKRLPQVKIPSIEAAPKPWIVMNPCTTNMAKAWPIEQYQALIALLVEELGGTYFAFGVEADKPLIEKVFSQLPANIPKFNLAGTTTLPETLSWMTQMSIVIGGDSGLAHIAALANRPQVVLFGPTDPQQWAPLSSKATILTSTEPLECRPCRLKTSCEDTYPCLTQITPQQVLKAILRHLKPATY